MQIPAHWPVTAHTDYVGKNSTFVAIKGYQKDGSDYIVDALKKGASTIVIQQDVILPEPVMHAVHAYNAQLVRVVDTRLALATLSAQAWNFPANKLTIIGITGTKGKTTSSYLLEHILRLAGHKTALISTVKNYILNVPIGGNLTTPQPDYLHMFFAQCLQAGVQYVIMEVSAQALSLHRVYGIHFDAALLTNISLEHMEFYASMDDYFLAKCKLLELVKSHASVFVNSDDEWGKKIAQQNSAYRSFSMQDQLAHYYGRSIACSLNGIKLETAGQTIECPWLVGTFNMYNVLGCSAVAQELGVSWPAIAQALAHPFAVPGRLERYQLPNGAFCFIDYAHNPSSFQALLCAMRPFTDHMIVVFGCGGDRDKTKRPLMGSIAAQLADLVIVTSDNPRSEDVQTIIENILSGISPEHMPKVICQPDRTLAIERAYALSKNSSLILLLGKGPDEYQIVGTTKTFFSEKQIIQEL